MFGRRVGAIAAHVHVEYSVAVASRRTTGVSKDSFQTVENQSFVVEGVPADATHGLRRAVLRDGRDDAEVVLPEDSVPGAFHLGARLLGPGAGDALVGVASLSPAPTPHRPGARAWRLRAMAVTPAARGLGVGRALLIEAVDRARAEGATVLWANARDTALGFYQRSGWEVEGEGHLSIGLPHHTVVLDL